MTNSTKKPELSIEEEVAKASAKLRLELEWKQLVKNKLKDIDALTYVSTGVSKEQNCIVVPLLKTKEQVPIILAAFPPCDDSYEIGTERDKYHQYMNTPFRIDIQNPSQLGHYSQFLLKVSYKSVLGKVIIQLPIREASPFVEKTHRKLTDSSRHMHPHMSDREYREWDFPAFKFKTDRQISWYGGDKTLVEESLIEDIMVWLK